MGAWDDSPFWIKNVVKTLIMLHKAVDVWKLMVFYISLVNSFKINTGITTFIVMPVCLFTWFYHILNSMLQTYILHHDVLYESLQV